MQPALTFPNLKPRPPVHSIVSDPYENDAKKKAQADYWRAQVDYLADGRLSWEHFFTLLPKEFFSLDSHPVIDATTRRDGHGLLHIAVYHNREDLIQPLARFSALKLRRNSYGLTPFELANYLNRKAIASLIQPFPRIRFLEQNNVEFEKSSKRIFLEDLEFLSHPIFESEELLDQILTRTKKAKAVDAIEPEKIWMGIYFDKEVQNGLHPKVSIRWIDDEIGFGVYAAQRIPSCSFVGEYTGVVQERRKKHMKDNYYCVRCTTWETGRKSFVIDAEKKGNFTRFINHSATPNLGLQSIYWQGLPRMVFISLKEIPQGSQLTFDYGSFFWKECQQIPKLF